MISRILASQALAGRQAAGRNQSFAATFARKSIDQKSTTWSLGLGCRRLKHATVSLQLDYYMSPQFTGIACAMVDGLYDKAGIDLRFMPICPVGLEMERVRQHRDASTDDLVVGSVEQNIFTPLLFQNPHLEVKAVAAMFRTSPLCLASVDLINDDGDKIVKDMEGGSPMVIGAHEDTVPLLNKILEQKQQRPSVVASPRSTKIMDLLEGRVDMIQAYTTTEVPTLERRIGDVVDGSGNALAKVSYSPLEGMNGAKLGYSQVLFSSNEDLESSDKRDVLQKFLDATFKGWGSAVRNHEEISR